LGCAGAGSLVSSCAPDSDPPCGTQPFWDWCDESSSFCRESFLLAAFRFSSHPRRSAFCWSFWSTEGILWRPFQSSLAGIVENLLLAHLARVTPHVFAFLLVIMRPRTARGLLVDAPSYFDFFFPRELFKVSAKMVNFLPSALGFPKFRFFTQSAFTPGTLANTGTECSRGRFSLKGEGIPHLRNGDAFFEQLTPLLPFKCI